MKYQRSTGTLAAVLGLAVASCGLTAQGQAVAQPATTVGAHFQDDGRWVPPPEYLAGAEFARSFVQRALNAEDVSDMVADYVIISAPPLNAVVRLPKWVMPRPEHPAEVNAEARRTIRLAPSAAGRAEAAAEFIDPASSPRLGYVGAPNCYTALSEYEIACTVLIRSAFGTGQVNVHMYPPEVGTLRTPVDRFDVVVALPSFTG